MKKILETQDRIVNDLYKKVEKIITENKNKMIYQINSTLVNTNFLIGKVIVENEQNGNIRAEYGKQILLKLSKKLTEKYGTGFSRTGLQNMRLFYNRYKKFQSVSGKCQPLAVKLSWSHYCYLIHIDDDDERNFYEKECINSKWSKRELKRQIDSSLYQRLLLSEGKTSKEKVLELSKEGQTINNPTDILKEPYVFEFLGIKENKPILENDLEKNRQCEKDGIKLYRIREGLPSLDDSSIDYIIQKDHKDLSIAIERIVSDIFGLNIDVNLERDTIAIENLREYTEKGNSLFFLNPEIANEWNYIRNGNLKPEFFASNSGKKVWWKCSKGHEWQATIQSRNKGCGCPFCAGKKAIKGENDLQTVNPELASEWNYEKNNGLTPFDVLPNSEKKVWWKCQKGHEWQSMIGNRNKGQRCPYCSGRRVLKGFNDLQTVHPSLAIEWNYEKNSGIKPTDVTAGSNKKVWWRCEKGHEWQAKVCDRFRGTECPYCAGNKVLKGFNDLQTVNPTLSLEWNYDKNGELTPEDITANNNKKVWWKCQKGHEWQATIYNRNKGTGCPVCRRQKVKANKN